MSADAKDLIKKILSIDPEKRYKIDDIRRHPWMSQVKLIREPTGIIVGLHKMPVRIVVGNRLINVYCKID